MPEPANALIPRPFEVVSTRRETHDVTTLMVEPADDRSCFEFEPAQFGMIGVPGVGEVPISFSNHPDTSRCLAVTIRAAGAVTAAITSTGVGGVISVRGPYGTAWPIDLVTGRDVLFVAGGLGLAPLRSGIFAVAEESSQRGSIGIVYGARTPGDMLFKGDLEIWSELVDVKVHLTVDHADDGWSGEVGLVTALFDTALAALTTPLVMMCGPDIMMINASRDLVARGVAADNIWLTMERNMKCAVGLCGHCQFGPLFVCKDGPVFRYDQISELLEIPEV
jgi:NAD(P)H-flavin reductase